MLDELYKLPEGHCILFIARVGAFYSKLYNLKEHPNYNDLYEAWDGNTDKLYDHLVELKYENNETYTMLCECGLDYAEPIVTPKIEEVNEDEIKNLIKMEVIRLEDLKAELKRKI